MVGTGTGLAPFRGFWQDRKVDMEMQPTPIGFNGTIWGEMILYFGCRRSNYDDLYKNEINQMLKENVLTNFYCAYSRNIPKKKYYVQHHLYENAQEIYNLIVNKKGHFYICGDVKMAVDVSCTLENIISDCGNIDIEDAKSYISEMKVFNFI